MLHSKMFLIGKNAGIFFCAKCLFAILTVISFSCRHKACGFSKIKAIDINRDISGVDTSYAHYILLEDFSKECADSSTIAGIVHNYTDTVSKKKPISLIMFYNSEDRFVKNEPPNSDEVNKDCIVKILYDKKTETPWFFMFYDDAGTQTYYGNRWLVKGN